ncbi:MAG: glycosyltransferase family 4 protein [Planctomycetes bacterium]|nr:glycosyltransferase family 4 protein [Planctomycetota bacterium]
MTRRRILVSAYACEPDQGSEAGIGWHWVREIARRHEVWLVTRENNVERIEQQARAEGLVDLHLVGYDLPYWMRFWKRGGRGALAYFYLWQLGLARRARALDREIGFDLVHHITFASSWIPSGLAFVGKPFVWGPVGRHPRIPDRFLPAHAWRVRLAEFAKAAWKRTCERADPLLARTRSRADLILCLGSAPECGAVPRGLAFLAAGADAVALDQHRFERGQRFEVLFAGRLVELKGVRLALESFALAAQSLPHARLVLLGDGPLREELEQRARDLGLAGRVEFRRQRPRTEVLEAMLACDVFLFPSFEGAGMVVIEAMAAGAPVVCLDWGGPGDMTADERGLRIAPAATPQATARALAGALLRLERDEELRQRLARRAHSFVLEQATWERKGERLDELYERAERAHAQATA